MWDLSFLTRDRIYYPCTWGQTPKPWTTREVPLGIFRMPSSVSLAMMCLGVAYSLSTVGVCCTSWKFRLMFFIIYGKIFAIISLNIFFAPFFSLSSSSEISIMHILVHLMISYWSLRIFFFIPFLLLSRQFILTYLLILSSVSPNMLLSPSNEFSIWLILLGNSRISIWFLFILMPFLILSFL